MKQWIDKTMAALVMTRKLNLAFLVLAMTCLASDDAGAQPSINSSGTASYSVPITVPPGIAGMVPNLSLLFSSTTLNGPVGTGWTIQGVSAITRCAGDKLIDGTARSVDYSVNDKLCLDGQRLVITDANGAVGTQGNDSQGNTEATLVREYRTEKDIYARIRAYNAAGSAENGPAYFRVWTKSGQIYEYGVGSNTTSNANITAFQQGIIVAWPVSRISDTFGNYIDFQYEQRDVAFGTANASFVGTRQMAASGKEWNLTEVRYTGTATTSPTNKVLFVYTDRPDTGGTAQDRSEAYHLGNKNVSVRILNNIQTYINWPAEQSDTPQAAVPVKNYVLTYDRGPVSGRSRLRKIAECAGAGANKCMPGTTFDYSSSSNVNYAANQAFHNSTLATTVLQNQAGTMGVMRADFNGDGKLDILRWSDTAAQNILFLSTPVDGQYTQASNFNIVDQNLFKSDGCYTSLIIDINGDGLPDILRYSSALNANGSTCSSYGPSYIYRNNGDGTFTRVTISGPTLERVVSTAAVNCVVPVNPTTHFCAEPGDHPGWSRGANFYLLDYDGDGITDIVTTQLPKYGINALATDPCLSMECTQVFHGNGDGTFTKTVTNLANVSIYTQPYASSSIGSAGMLKDVNRDGLPDLGGLDTSYFNKFTYYLSRGDGNFDGSTAPIANGCVYSIDFNGDGLDDCVVPGATAAANKLYTREGPNTLSLAPNFNLTSTGYEMVTTSGIDVGDFDGDGRGDIIRWQDNPGGNQVYLSNGDGTFRSAQFNLNTPNDQLQKSDGTAGFILGDFIGRGNTEILRMISAPSTSSEATRNQLYARIDPTQADQLTTVTSPMGIRSNLTWAPLTNAADGAYGPRYVSDRGTAFAATYPVADVIWPTYVVTTMSTDSGTGVQLATEYGYAGMKIANDGRGFLGFRQMRQQHAAPNGDNLTVSTQYLQTGAFDGMAAVSETRLGALDTSGSVISRTTNIYCDTTATAAPQSATMAAPCLSTAKVQRPYLFQTKEEGTDLNGASLPTVVTTNTFNNSGDPTTIAVTTSGVAVGGLAQTFVKTTSNQYQADATSGDTWILGRLIQATVNNSVPNSIGSIATGSSGSPGGGGTPATTAALALSCVNGAATTSPTPATTVCSLNNTGSGAAASISYSSIPNATVSGPTGACAAGTTCGTVTVTSGSAVGNYGGTLVATPNAGTAGTANIALVVVAGSAAITPSETSHAYGTVLAGGIASHTFTVTNTGQVATANLTVLISGSGTAGHFYGTTTCTGTLSTGTSCTVTASFETYCGAIRAGSEVNGTIAISGANFTAASIALSGQTAGGNCL